MANTYFCTKFCQTKGAAYAILFLMLATAACAFAETDGLPSPRNKTYHGYYYFRTEHGDSALMLVINNITVFPLERFKTKIRSSSIGAPSATCASWAALMPNLYPPP